MRNRMISAEINKSKSLAACSLEAELAFILLWRSLDDAGCVELDPDVLISESYFRRTDVGPDRYMGWISELVGVGCLRAYTDGERVYLDAPKWSEWQRINRPSKSHVPSYSPKAHTLLSEHSLSIHIQGQLKPPPEGPQDTCGKPVDSVSAHGVLTLKEGRKERTIGLSSLGVGESAAPDGALSSTCSLKEFEEQNPDVKVPGFLKRAFGRTR